MSEFESETPVEELPGILGYQWDDFDFVSLSEATSSLTADLVRDFDEQASYLTKNLPVKVRVGLAEIDVAVEPGERLIGLLDALPAVDVLIDCPPDQGPSGGAGYLVFIADGHTLEQAGQQIAAFVGAMEAALAEIRRLNDE